MPLVAVVGPLAAHAQTPLGGEFRVNSYTTSFQTTPSVAMDHGGNFVVVWASLGQDGSFNGVFGQLFASSGVPLGGEFQVNTHTSDSQEAPSVAIDADGNFVVVWSSVYQDGAGSGIFGQRFTSDGFLSGDEIPVNTYTTDQQFIPAVAMDAAGNFVVVWESDSEDGSGDGIVGRRYTSDGDPMEAFGFPVNTYTTLGQVNPSVARDPTGDFVVAWASLGQDGSSLGVFGQRFDSDSPEGPEFQANIYTTGSQRFPSVAMDAGGNFVVVWESGGQDGSGYGIFHRRYESDGDPVLNFVGFSMNTYTTGDQRFPTVAMDPAGNFVVVWQSQAQDGSGYGIFAQRFTSNGARLGREFQVNTYTTGNQAVPSVAMDRGGNFVVVWHGAGPGDSLGIFGQRFRFGELDFFIGEAEEGIEGDPSSRPFPAARKHR